MDQKNSFTKCFPLGLRNLKWVLESGKRIFRTGNGIIYLTSRSSDKKFVIHYVFLVIYYMFDVTQVSVDNG